MMLKDVMLVKTSDDTWDWNFNDDDVVTVIGNSRLASALVHSVMLRLEELDLPWYTGRGCSAHRHYKNNSLKAQSYIRESIISSVKQVYGVQDATVELDASNPSLIVSSVTVMTEDGEEVKISAI